MARARLLKPGYFANEDLAEIEPFGRLLFAGLWTLADREGRLLDKPRRIKAALFPYDNLDVDGLLVALRDGGFITRYIVADEAYIQVVNFLKHQTPHVREPKSTLPAQGATEAHMRLALDEPESGPAVAVAVPETVAKTVAVPETVAPDVPVQLPVIRAFEHCFGRPLSPMEIEGIKALDEEHPRDRIDYALREAADLNKRSVRYIQRVCENQSSGATAGSSASTPRKSDLYDE